MDTVAESIVFVPDLPDIITAGTWTSGGLCSILLFIAVSVSLGQAPWQKAGLQPGMLGGDPE